MGKTAPLKKKGATSVHSRAAKRASSPSIDTDKSLKDVKAPVETTYHPQVLAVHQGAGVSKKKNGKKQLSAKARRRQEKGMDRAEAVMDRTERKVEKSKGRGRNVQERAKNWDELNKKIALKKALEDLNKKENEGQEDMDDDENQSEVEMDEATPAPIPTEATAQSVPLPAPVEEEEIL
ncbi:Ribosome biogenesis Alb1 protein [Rutstroemia sp. NJR-2017a BBW]|nr:Ribosome biogenesis Alb1 protein [Rutstroemia sp. NJR-2017a BBW]